MEQYDLKLSNPKYGYEVVMATLEALSLSPDMTRIPLHPEEKKVDNGFKIIYEAKPKYAKEPILPYFRVEYVCSIRGETGEYGDNMDVPAYTSHSFSIQVKDITPEIIEAVRKKLDAILSRYSSN